MEQTRNTIFKVETYDVAKLKSNWRIVYFPDKVEIMVVTSYGKAMAVQQQSARRCLVLSKSQAPKAFPQVFTNSEIKGKELQQRTIILKVSPEQYAFVNRFGNVTAYLRSLIDRQMKYSIMKTTTHL